MMVTVVVMVVVLAVMVMVGNSNEQTEGKKGSCHRIGYIYSGSSAHSVHTYGREHHWVKFSRTQM